MSKDKYIGSTITVKIIEVHIDSCDVIFEKGAKGRLYQYDSLARDDEKPLIDLSDKYYKGRSIEVMVTHLRENHDLYFVNERWARDNPWADMNLKVGDIIIGSIVKRVEKKGETEGYFVQLNSEMYVESEDYLQPDIPVYLPVEEVPWADGSISEFHEIIGYQRLELWKEDLVELEVIEVNSLPLYPQASLKKRMNYRDKYFFEEGENKQFLANLVSKFWNKESLGIDYQFKNIKRNESILSDNTILLIDDNDDNLENMSKILKANGASVICVSAKKKKLTLLQREVDAEIKRQRFDLILVDFSLPHPYQGIQLIEGLIILNDKNIDNMPNISLMSAHLTETEVSYARKKLPNLHGSLLRPLRLNDIKVLCDGKKIWQKLSVYDDSEHANKPSQSLDVSALLNWLFNSDYVNFICLLEIKENDELEELARAGDVPFRANAIKGIKKESDLRILVNNKKDSLIIEKDGKKSKNTPLIGVRDYQAAWFRISLVSGKNLIVGFGIDVGQEKLIDLILKVVRQQVSIQAWGIWAQHHASFISSGLLIHSLAHEYRNYLNRLTTLGSVFRKIVANEDFQKLDRAVKGLKEDTTNLKELTDSLLQGLSQRIEPMNIRELLKYVERLIEPAFKEFDTQLKIFESPDVTLGVPRAAVTIPLINLLLNAGKHQYRDEARMVLLVSRVVKYDTENMMEFWVYDNGPGIHERDMLKIFEAGVSFAEADEERHGIGLWLSRQILKSVNGRIEVMSNLRGLGCTFRLSIPLVVA
jgi:signal transduction histidine kinase/CheY-like chemotaxis protein